MTAPARRWLTGGWVFDGTGADRFRADVALRGSRIAEIRRGGVDQHVSDRETRVDVSGMTLLPGLIDAHAHVGLIDLGRQPQTPPAVQAGIIFRTLRSCLDQGFTTLRDLGGVDGGLVAAIDRGLVEGPRILPSGEIISQTAGHGDHRSPYGAETANPDLGSGGIVRAMRIADGVDQVRRAARDQYRRGATQLKLFAGGGQLSEGDPIDSPQYSEEELAAAVQVAADRNSYVTVHAHTARCIKRALGAGVRCFEHGTVVDAETAGMLRDAGAVVVPTLTVAEILRTDPESWGIPEHWLDDAKELDEAAVESIRLLDQVGVPLGSGSDLIGADQAQRGWELTLKARILGASNAIQSATRVNARILGVDANLGTIEEGKVADIVAYHGDPLINSECFMRERPVVVVQNGEVVRSSTGDVPAAQGRSGQ